MKKTTKIFFVGLISIFFFSLPAEEINAEESTTFPVDQAGISAYAKINDYGPEKLAEVLYFGREKIEPDSSTHIIVSFEMDIKIESQSGGSNVNQKTYPLIYLNTDGWMVAYYPKEEPASKIMQWTNYSPGNLNSTILEDALIEMAENINTSFSTPVKYYHFNYPDANRMTLIAETVFHQNEKENSFTVIVPGTIHEASYFMYYSFLMGNSSGCHIKLFVDNNEIDSLQHNSCHGNGLKSSKYESNLFKSNIAYLVSLSASGGIGLSFQGGAATVFIYEV